ncbi:hypothetical protein [Halomonas smyrnensis]|uniref:hypothetical protein n=1 Tax=Halomonas smyrnensis TaxID=720605 RepID=UPI0012EAD5EB|nr:hypothetical protein [Halomonas smyrnensis]
MTDTRPGRPRGRPNTKPSKAAVANYYRLLQGAADQGDTLAAGVLVMNDTVDRHCRQARTDRLRRELESEGGTMSEILGRGRRYLLDLAEQIDEDQPRDAAGLQQGQGLRDAAPAETTGKAGSAAGGDPASSGVSESRRDLGNEHPTQAEQETPQ